MPRVYHLHYDACYRENEPELRSTEVPWNDLCDCVAVQRYPTFGNSKAELLAGERGVIGAHRCDGTGALRLPPLDPAAGSIPLASYEAILRGERIERELSRALNPRAEAA